MKNGQKCQKVEKNNFFWDKNWPSIAFRYSKMSWLSKKYITPKIWYTTDPSHNLNNFHLIENSNGSFLIHKSDLHCIEADVGENVEVNVLRYDLLAWYSIEQT